MTTIEPGRVIAEKYRLEEELGSGGMGSIWRGHDERLDAPVAVKFMHTELARDPQLRARFEREAKAAAKIRSPHVVHMYDHGIEDDTPYLVMELLVGEDLGQRMKRCGSLPPPEIERICSEVCKGLHRAHAMGIIHRDLKPANVFLSAPDDDLVKLLDFGIAKAKSIKPAGSEATSTGELLGSPHYMSPEQLKGKDLDGRSDLWAVAVILYRLVVGKRPYDGGEMIELCMRICHEPAPAPSSIRPELGSPFDRFFERAFCLDPDDRFQSAKELSVAFAEVIRGAPAVAGEPPRATDSRSSRDDGSGRGTVSTTINAPGDEAAAEATRTPVASSRTLADHRSDQQGDKRRDRRALVVALVLVASGGLAALLFFGATDDDAPVTPAASQAPAGTEPSGPSSVQSAPPTGSSEDATAAASSVAPASGTAASSAPQASASRPLGGSRPIVAKPWTRSTATGTSPAAPPTVAPTVAPPPDVALGY
ncbi:MAG: serine/threonine protein kinase [Deltaproteobacteria bacterium]|nr:serine/threonine protein kinase [Deltaproteobacteria bacterium]